MAGKGLEWAEDEILISSALDLEAVQSRSRGGLGGHIFATSEELQHGIEDIRPEGVSVTAEVEILAGKRDIVLEDVVLAEVVEVEDSL